MNLVSYSSKWPEAYQREKDQLLSVFGDNVVQIEHIGSTAIPGIKSKPIVDIMVKVASLENAPQYIEHLEKLGYRYSKERSSTERYFCTKGDPTEFHLSITDGATSFWKRQLLFRDYLRNNPSIAKEYENLKVKLIEKYPSGKDEYSYGKSEFVQNVLGQAMKE